MIRLLASLALVAAAGCGASQTSAPTRSTEQSESSREAPDATPTPGRVLVVNTADSSVSLVDLATMRELRRMPVGDHPYGIAIAPDGRSVVVGVEGEKVLRAFSF